MTENDFISNAKKKMISISEEILASLSPDLNNTSLTESFKSFQDADYFEEHFSAQAHAMLFNLLREFESEHHVTISNSIGKEVERVYDIVLLTYGRHLACGWLLPINIEFNAALEN